MTATSVLAFVGSPASRPLRTLSSLVLAALVIAASAGTALAQDARAAFRVERGEPHAGLPFVLSLIAEGLDESPAPAPPALAIPNAKVVAMGATPNVSQSIQIINGRRIDSREVRWVFRYRVEASEAGVLKVPATTVVQGAKKVTAPGGDVEVSSVSATADMKIELKLPARPVWVGEVLPVEISWLLRRNAEDQTLVVPMLAQGDQFLIAAPPATNPRQTLAFAAGARDLTLPYEQDQIDLAGARYTRFRFTVFATPRRAGKIDLAPSSVVAALAVGQPDIFGQSATRLFRATDVARTLEVKDLPLADRPASFSGAVGSTFSLSTSASRSVVQLGEPVELTITVRSDQRLDALAAPTLAGDGGLPADKFTLPTDLPSGELSADGTSKTFKISVQVTGPATEIPALAFSYFDPVKGIYQTTKSQPIALAVRGGAIVGASDVVSAQPGKPQQTATPGPTAAGESMSGADLVLSTPSMTTAAPLGGAPLLLALVLLYAVPLGLLTLRWWQRRTASQRGEAAEVRSARRRVEAELAKAATAPARDSAGPLGEALRALAKALQLSTSGTPIDRLETEAYAPSAANQPLSAELRAALAELVKGWARKSKPRSEGGSGKSAAASALLLIALAAGGRQAAAAEPGVEGALAQARTSYEQAMQLPTAQIAERRELFGRAQAAFREAVRALPDRPELLVDWGNAALNAGDVATATLAYRRALALDGAQPRATHNLALLRSKHAEAYRASADSATGTLFFFHTWPRARRLLVGALGFAVAILLLVPWRRNESSVEGNEEAVARQSGRRRGARALSLVPFAVWAAMTLSLLLEDRHLDDAVVMESVVLRAADSLGAPAAISQPVPRGAEVSIVSRRDSWARIRLPSGSAGWVPSTSIEAVVAR
jgi:tetratricopeptide (TPR) repeat protein